MDALSWLEDTHDVVIKRFEKDISTLKSDNNLTEEEMFIYAWDKAIYQR